MSTLVSCNRCLVMAQNRKKTAVMTKLWTVNNLLGSQLRSQAEATVTSYEGTVHTIGADDPGPSELPDETPEVDTMAVHKK